MKLRNLIHSILALVTSLITVACLEKKCQRPAEQSFNSLTDAEWRLVETNDPNPNFKKLNNTTFFIFTFAKNYTGAVNNVINNDKYDNPVRTFKYNIDPASNLIRIKYEIPTSDGGSGASSPDGADPSTAPDNTPPIDYVYELKRDLTLTNSFNGAYYRFVPFTGIVDPDNQCTF